MKVLARPVSPGLVTSCRSLHAGVLRFVRDLRRGLLADHHAVAGGAGDAVAPERRVMREPRGRVVGRVGDGIECCAREWFAGAGLRVTVDGVLAMTLHGVAAHAGVLDEGRGLRMEGLDLAGELGEEDGIAPAHPHGRFAPGAVGRDVGQLRLRLRRRLGHVELQAGAAGAVAAEALIGGDEARVGRRLAGRDPHMVVSLRRQLGRPICPTMVRRSTAGRSR